MRIIVRPPTRKPTLPDTDDSWLLVSDTWNDYGFRTLYAVYRLHQGSLVEVGGLKVMRKGQVTGALSLPEGELEGGILPDDCASIGASLDFYANLRKLGRPETMNVLKHFRDVAVDEERRHAFEKEEAFATSLHRDRTDHQTYYSEVATVIESGGLPPEPSQWGFSYQQEPQLDPIQFRFGRTDGKKFATHEPQPERRSVVLVGANGVGKTRLLASLARVAYTPPGERKADSIDGVIIDDAAFPSIVAVAYSAFDDFLPPDLEGDDRTQVSRQLAEGTGRYVYCGTRDLAAHVLDPAEPQRLLNQEALAALFVDRLDRVQTTSRNEIFAAAMAPVLDEISTRRDFVRGEQLPTNPVEAVLRRLQLFLTEDPQAAFKDLSSGHKIVLLMLAGITASLKPRGIVLIDEPETHLHPPLLAALMTGVRRILSRLESYAIIATHSPVVAQETLASQIIVFEGQGVTRSPTIQTFGENVGALTREIFGLVPGGTDYRHVLERMAKRYPDPAQLEAAMGEPLSSQATAHVLSAIRGKG